MRKNENHMENPVHVFNASLNHTTNKTDFVRKSKKMHFPNERCKNETYVAVDRKNSLPPRSVSINVFLLVLFHIFVAHNKNLHENRGHLHENRNTFRWMKIGNMCFQLSFADERVQWLTNTLEWLRFQFRLVHTHGSCSSPLLFLAQPFKLNSTAIIFY